MRLFCFLFEAVSDIMSSSDGSAERGEYNVLSGKYHVVGLRWIYQWVELVCDRIAVVPYGGRAADR